MVNRRLSLFVCVLAWSCAAIPVPPPTPQPTPPTSPLGKAVIQQSDFSYVGCFRLPQTGIAGDPAYGKGLTHRYVDGQLRFITRSYNSASTTNPVPAYEVNAPTSLGPLPATAPQVTVQRVWGDVYGSYRFGEIWGFYWDPIDGLLYWSTGHPYNITQPRAPSIGVSRLNEATGTATPLGVWGLTNRSIKMIQGGLLAVPDWFSAQYAPGRRLAAGFGGNFSGASAGPISSGPALSAFNPAQLLAAAPRSSIASTTLVGYPFNGVSYTKPDRARRDPNYISQYGGWAVKNGVGYWTMLDYIWQGGVWIDTPTKSGVVFFPTLANGRTWYATSTVHAEGGTQAWMVYDPTDLALVAQGKKQQWQIQPASQWIVGYPGALNPMPAWHNGPAQQVVGATYDSTTQTLYIAVWHVIKPIVVYAYRVS